MSADENINDLIIEEKLESPSSFLFPFTPYGIQHGFMTELYSALENKKLGIFESPTGTVSNNIDYIRFSCAIVNTWKPDLSTRCVLN